MPIHKVQKEKFKMDEKCMYNASDLKKKMHNFQVAYKLIILYQDLNELKDENVVIII